MQPDNRFYVTGGTLPLDADSYIVRQADRQLLDVLCRGEFCYVLNTRQMGKSSLMIRAARQLREKGWRVVLLDLTALGQNLSVEQWYFGLVGRMAAQLDLEDSLFDFWKSHKELGPMQRFVETVRMLLQPQAKGEAAKLAIFVDEIDAVRSLAFSTDEFFAGIRECYNRRANEPEFRNLNFCLLGVATPGDLIQDTRISPFNIGQRIELQDFRPDEAEPLARGMDDGNGTPGGLSRRTTQLLQRILHWTNGHPYMTQRLCLAVAERRASLPDQQTRSQDIALVDTLCDRLFLSRAAREIDDNLAFVRNRLLHSESDVAALLDLYRLVRAGKRVPDDETNVLCGVLRLSGVVTIEKGLLRLRNRIYAHVFDAAWVQASLPDEERRRQQRAYRQGLLRATTTGGFAALSMLVLTVLALRAQNEARDLARKEQDANRRSQKALVAANRLSEQVTSLLSQEQQSVRRVNFALHKETLANAKVKEALRKAKLAQRQADTNASLAGQQRTKAEREGRNALTQQQIAKRQTELVEQARYDSDIQLTSQTQHEGNVPETLALLEAHLPRKASGDRREFAWRYLWGLAHRSSPVPLPPGHVPVSGGLAPDGTLFAVDSKHCLVALKRNARTFQYVQPLAEQADVNISTLSPDGLTLALHSRIGRLALLDTSTLAVRHVLVANGWGHLSWAFSPDSRWLATLSTAGDVAIWNMRTGRQEHLTHGFPLQNYQIVVSATGDHFSLSPGVNGPGVEDFDARFSAMSDARQGKFAGNGLPISAVAYSPDGKRIAYGDLAGRILVQDVATHTEVCHFDSVGRWRTSALAFAPDGQTIAVARLDSRLFLYSLGRPEEAHQLASFTAPLVFVAWSADGQRLAGGSQDGTLHFCDATPLPDSDVLQVVSSSICHEVLSPEDSQIMLSRHSETILFDLRRQTIVRSFETQKEVATAVAFVPRSNLCLAATYSLKIHLYDRATGALKQTFTELDADRSPMIHCQINTLAVSADGEYMAAALDGPGRQSRNDCNGLVWNLRTRTLCGTLPNLPEAASNVKFSPDGEWLGLATLGARVLLLKKSEWSRGRRGVPPKAARTLTIDAANLGEAVHIAFTPDSRRVAVAGFSGKITLFDIASGKLLKTMRGHTGAVTDLSFSPDGLTLASGSLDATVKLWDAISGRSICTFAEHKDAIQSVFFSHSGTALYTSSLDRNMRILKASPLSEIDAFYRSRAQSSTFNDR